MIVNFEAVKLNGAKTKKCACGKRLTRSKTIEQTINLYNLKDGRLKTRQEIIAESNIKMNEWYEEPVFCSKCL